MIAFIALALTGLPQKFADTDWAIWRETRYCGRWLATPEDIAHSYVEGARPDRAEATEPERLRARYVGRR